MPSFYACRMQSRSNRGWRPPRWWELKLKDWSARQIKRLDPSPEAGLSGTQAVLRHSLRRGGPDSPRTVNAMIQVADQLSGRSGTARNYYSVNNIVQALHIETSDHSTTIRSGPSWHLGTCLFALEREEDAEPQLACVVGGE